MVLPVSRGREACSREAHFLPWLHVFGQRVCLAEELRDQDLLTLGTALTVLEPRSGLLPRLLSSCVSCARCLGFGGRGCISHCHAGPSGPVLHEVPLSIAFGI